MPTQNFEITVTAHSGQVHPWQGKAMLNGKCFAITGFCKSEYAARMALDKAIAARVARESRTA